MMKKRTKLLSAIMTLVMAIGLMSANAFAAYGDPVYKAPTIAVNKTSVNAGDEVVYTVKQEIACTPDSPPEYALGSFNLRTYLPDEVQFVSATAVHETSYERTSASINAPGGKGEINCWHCFLYFTHNSEENYVDLDDPGYSPFQVYGQMITITIKTKALETGNPKNWFAKTVYNVDAISPLSATIGTEAPAHDHDLSLVPAKEATCTEAGNIEYYICSICNKKFKDAAGTQKIANPQIAALGHKWTVTSTRKATLTADGNIHRRCTRCNAEQDVPIYRPANFKLSATDFTYDGKAKAPAITVTDSKGGRITNFTVSYANNKAIGTGTATVTMNGNYTGSKTLTFRINPPGTSLIKLVKAKKALTVKWKKKGYGYQIQYGLKANFAGAKIATVSKAKTTSKKIGKLKAKKKYYVRIRTYKKVGSTTYVSGWSSVKSAKTK